MSWTATVLDSQLLLENLEEDSTKYLKIGDEEIWRLDVNLFEKYLKSYPKT